MKETRHETPHTVQFHLREMARTGKSRQKADGLLPGVRGGESGECLLTGVELLFLGGGEGCIALNLLKITGRFLNG